MKVKNLREKYWAEGVKQGQHACSVWMDAQSGPPRYPNDLFVNPEKYGAVRKSTRFPDLNHKYLWGWIDGFEQECILRINKFYITSFQRASKFIAEHNMVHVDDLGNETQEVWMQCHLCGQMSVVTDFMRVPYTSNILCINCGNFMPRGSNELFVETGSDQPNQSGQTKHCAKTE